MEQQSLIFKSPAKSLAKSPAKSPHSPFLRPNKRFTDFLNAKKKKKLLFQSPSKAKKKQSPLKLLKNIHNSPKSPKSNGKSPNNKRKQRTPVKFPIDNYLRSGRMSGSKSPLGSKNKSSSSTPRSTKRQLNFGTKSPSTSKSPSALPVECITIDEEANLEAPTKRLKPEDEIVTGEPKLPIDWSLKSRIRFTSQKSFPYRGNFRASEDSTGITSFVRCIHPTIDDASVDSGFSCSMGDSSQSSQPNSQIFSPNSMSNKKQQIDTSLAAVLKQHTMVWSHPHLPWLSLFPRIDVKTPAVKGVTFQIDPSSSIAESLLTDWTSSLRSLFHLLKTRQAPYFYICAPTFTILVRASGIGGISDIHALITPTTSGFRDSLKREGISFVLPFMDWAYDALSNSEKSVSIHSNASQMALLDESSRASIVSSVEVELNKNNELEDENVHCDEDEEPDQFLESLGLSQQDFPSLITSKRTKAGKCSQGSKASTSRQIKKQSLVFVSGPDVQLLINFLTNDPKLITTTSGPLASIPPTLLSPICFSGATLTPLKLKLNSSTYQNKQFFSLDIVGPILPTSVTNLSEYFKTTQDGNFKMNLISVDSTAPLSAFDVHPSSLIDGKCPSANDTNFSCVFATESLKDCGLSCDLIQDLCSKTSTCNDPLTDVTLINNLFNCNKSVLEQ